MAMRETTVRQGRLAGVACNDPSITVFKGVPYAKPPVGQLRWKAPQPAEPWEGTRKAFVFSARGMQQGQLPGSFYQKEFYPYDEPQSEDCLYLNVWTPADSADEKLPVYFWIHGGGFSNGYGYSSHFNGEGFARRGVILVTINYRLGMWGFLANPELSAESPTGTSGNYALLDMIAALKWVRENIEAFGGDPENVTIGGQSAGGGAVQALCYTQLSRGLFKRAILQSGGGIDRTANYLRLAAAEQVTDLKALFGVSNIAEARAVPAEQMQAVLNTIKRGVGPQVCGQPIIDGYVLTEADMNITSNPHFKEVEYLFGCNGDEGVMGSISARSADEFKAAAEKLFGGKAAEFLSLCDLSDFDSFMKEFNLEQKKCYYAVWCEIAAKSGKPAYTYQFTYPLPGDSAGAFHAAELIYVFQTFMRSWRPMTGVDFEISTLMANYWSSFIKTGDPNQPGMGRWEPYTDASQGYLEICKDTGMRSMAPSRRMELLKENILSRVVK